MHFQTHELLIKIVCAVCPYCASGTQILGDELHIICQCPITTVVLDRFALKPTAHATTCPYLPRFLLSRRDHTTSPREPPSTNRAKGPTEMDTRSQPPMLRVRVCPPHTHHIITTISVLLTCPLMMRTQHRQTMTTIFHSSTSPWLLTRILIWFAFITGNSSLEPLIEGLCAQIHVNLRWRVFHTTNQHHARIPRPHRSTAHWASYRLLFKLPTYGWCLGRISEGKSNPKRKVCKQVVNFIVFYTDDGSSRPHCLSLENYNIDGDNDSPNHTWMLPESSNPQTSSSGQV